MRMAQDPVPVRCIECAREGGPGDTQDIGGVAGLDSLAKLGAKFRRVRQKRRQLLPLTSDPTFCPREAHKKSRSETNGGLWSDRCSFSLSPIHAKKRFTRSIIPTAESAR
jgi:hypothetical protein